MPRLHSFLEEAEIIFFDAGGTLFYPYPSVGVLYSEVASRYGQTASAESIQRQFHEVWKQRHGLTDLSSHSNAKIERAWWRHLVRDVFEPLGGVRDFETFFDELYNLFASPESWRLYDESLEVLEVLRQSGKRMAMISNWDSRLIRLCRELGVEEYMEFILISAVFGASKPGKAIFNEALRKAGVKPDRAVHIGDSYEDDVQGALNAGMAGIWVDRHGFLAHTSIPGERRIAHISDLRKVIVRSPISD